MYFYIGDYGLVVQIGNFLFESYNTIDYGVGTMWGVSSVALNGTMVCVGGDYPGVRVYRNELEDEDDCDFYMPCEWHRWAELLDEDY